MAETADNLGQEINPQIQKQNDLLITRGDGYGDELSRLREDGWFSGKWHTANALVLPSGMLAPVGEGHHDSTARRALQEMNISFSKDDAVQAIFIDSGGIITALGDRGAGSYPSIALNEIKKGGLNLRTAVRFVLRDCPDAGKVEISTKDGVYDYSPDSLRESDFDPSKTQPQHTIEFK